MKIIITYVFAFSVVAFFVFLGGCTKDKAVKPSDIIDTVACIAPGEIITYTGDVMRIMETYCTAYNTIDFGTCHQSEANGGYSGLDYTTYLGIQEKVTDNTLINRVFNSPGNPMPSSITTGPQTLTDCDKLKLQAWVDAGAPEF